MDLLSTDGVTGSCHTIELFSVERNQPSGLNLAFTVDGRIRNCSGQRWHLLFLKYWNEGSVRCVSKQCQRNDINYNRAFIDS